LESPLAGGIYFAPKVIPRSAEFVDYFQLLYIACLSI